MDNERLLDRLDHLERLVAELIAERDDRRRQSEDDDAVWNAAFPGQSQAS
ncbi:hypothetical protein SAMN05192583_1037 [Sphingomonas gellani]|uniref:Uncharacterized protein n=1 Tax=Sphingomonas gellani TaxID=1166340 RepID=A0A1H8AUL9_9SPHN|nr:hypothetical protein [Sphingomonas gellani]SEM73489.1 hypothetical protein SAMN05192583_1037 [Sphingomonas gellani]